MRPLAVSVATAGAGLMGAAALSLVIAVITARILGVEEFGLYGFAFAYVSLWGVMMDGGASALAPREVARDGGRTTIAALFTLKPMLAGVALGLALVVGALAGFDRMTLTLVAVLGAGTAVDACFGLMLGVFRGRERFGIDALHQVGQRALFGILAVAALVGRTGAIGVASARAASLVVATTAAVMQLRGEGAVGALMDRGALRERGPLIVASAPSFLVADLMTQVHTRAGSLVLGWLRGLVDVGLYVAPARIVEGLALLPTALGIALLPRLVEAGRHGADRVADEVRTALGVAGALGAAVSLSGLVWADEVVVLLFGESYAGSAEPLRILLAAVLLMLVNAVMRTALIAGGAERAFPVAFSVATAVNLALNVLLVPTLGASGTAWSALSSEAVLFLALRAALGPRIPAFLPLGRWLVLALGATAAYAILMEVKTVTPLLGAVLTVGIAAGGFELASPAGLRDLVRAPWTRE